MDCIFCAIINVIAIILAGKQGLAFSLSQEALVQALLEDERLLCLLQRTEHVFPARGAKEVIIQQADFRTTWVKEFLKRTMLLNLTVVSVYTERTLPEATAGQKSDGVVGVKSKVSRSATPDELLGNPGVVQVVIREVVFHLLRQRGRFVIKETGTPVGEVL